MTTIADELLNDFEDDGEEEQEEQNEGFFGQDGSSTLPSNGRLAGPHAPETQSMELDGDEEEPDDPDAEGVASSHLKMEDAEDEEETKARVEKMQLHSVGDVRSVAGLMKQLEPILEVSTHPAQCSFICRRHLHIVNTALTYLLAYSKSNIIRLCHQTSRRGTSAVSKTTQSTSC